MRHTLLEHDERTGWALVYTCPEAVQRYCVCYRYDKQAGDWAQGHYTDDLLDAVEMYRAETGRPIGATAIRSILADAERALRPLVRRAFEPNEGVYRLDDMGSYVSEADFESYWDGKPEWRRKAWMLADNGTFTEAEVAEMSVGQIEEAYDDPSIEPEIAFYTIADEDGLC